MDLTILFGTESGNAELLATELAESLEGVHAVEQSDLADFDPACFDARVLYLIICSTHGEGEFPQSAVPFAEAIRRAAPDLSGIRYAMFGLGDSTYPNYSRGSEQVDALLAELHAERVGTYGRHDAAGRDEATVLAIAWANEVLDTASARVAA